MCNLHWCYTALVSANQNRVLIPCLLLGLESVSLDSNFFCGNHLNKYRSRVGMWGINLNIYQAMSLPPSLEVLWCAVECLLFSTDKLPLGGLGYLYCLYCNTGNTWSSQCFCNSH